MRRRAVTNTANVSGGGETNTANDAANDPTTIDGASAVGSRRSTKTHAGNFSQGQTRRDVHDYGHNVGRARRSGAVTVTDTLPAA